MGDKYLLVILLFLLTPVQASDVPVVFTTQQTDLPQVTFEIGEDQSSLDMIYAGDYACETFVNGSWSSSGVCADSIAWSNDFFRFRGGHTFIYWYIPHDELNIANLYKFMLTNNTGHPNITILENENIFPKYFTHTQNFVINEGQPKAFLNYTYPEGSQITNISIHRNNEMVYHSTWPNGSSFTYQIEDLPGYSDYYIFVQDSDQNVGVDYFEVTVIPSVPETVTETGYILVTTTVQTSISWWFLLALIPILSFKKLKQRH